MTFSQNADFQWAYSFGSLVSDEAKSVTSDVFGNIYVAGVFQDTVDFDYKSGVYNLISNGQEDAFVQKIDQNGNLIWAKSFGGINDDRVASIKTDAVGNCYVVGIFHDTVDFNPGTGIFNLISTSDYDIFILKLNQYGQFVWAKSIGGISTYPGFHNDEARDMSISDQGHLLITGNYQGVCDFDPGSSVYNLTSNGNSDAFILKLDTSGQFIWAQSVGGNFADKGNSIATDSVGNVFITGDFGATCDFDPSSSVYNITSNSGADIFILKLDSSGQFNWAKSNKGNGMDKGDAIVVDNSGDIYVTGSFRDTVT